MSGGTMIACSCKKIIMGKQSNLGPIDPQFGNTPAHGVIKEFETAVSECSKDPAKVPMWQVIINKYSPAFLGECQNAIDFAGEVVHKRLTEVMFESCTNKEKKAKAIVNFLNEHDDSKTHSRHIGIDEIKECGLKVLDMEDDQTLQDLILTIHHCFMHTFDNSPAIKIIENHQGIGIIEAIN